MSEHPEAILVVSFFALWLAARVGATIRRLRHPEGGMGDNHGTILAATLTLLALIIGFTLSMAVTRYDQRKNLEEEEANAIGTEYLRAGLLPAADADKLRTLLRSYLDQRVCSIRPATRRSFVKSMPAPPNCRRSCGSRSRASAAAHPTPTVALAVGGVNDVLNSQGYTQAAWWNRIPSGAWLLMGAIAILGNLLLGLGSRRAKDEGMLLLVLPTALSVSFFLIADIDSPRYGVIRVPAQNLTSLSMSLRAHDLLGHRTSKRFTR
jgi:hypothetical protein